MTYSPFQGNLFADESISSPEGFRASHSARPESEKGEAMTDISSPRCFELYRRFDPAGLSLKTFADCLVSNLDGYSRKLSHFWKAKITKSQRFVFLLQPSMLRTDEIDYGLLPTIRFSDAERGGRGDLIQQLRGNENKHFKMIPTPMSNDAKKLNVDQRKTLTRTITMLPTPRTRGLLGGSGSGSKQMMQDQVNAGQVSVGDANGLMGIQMLPTPTTQEIEHDSPALTPSGRRLASNGNSHGVNLADTIKMLPTPRSADGDKGVRSPEGHRKTTELATNGQNPGLKLQPAFALWMMGYPEIWCDLKDGE